MVAIREAKHQWPDKEHFLSSNDYISGQSMPPSFKYRKWGFGYRWHAFVEYVVEATVKEAKGSSSIKLSIRTATLPLVVRDVAKSQSVAHSLPLNIQFRIPSPIEQKPQAERPSTLFTTPHIETMPYTIRSSKLLLWDRDTTSNMQRSPTLSFSNSMRERTKSVFSPNSLPRFTFDITVSTPESIQILDEEGIPFVISAVPVKDGDKTTIPPERYPDLKVEYVSLSVKALTYIRFKSLFKDRAADTESDIKLLDRQPVNKTIVMYHGRLARQSSRVVNSDEGQDDDQSHRTNDSNSVDILEELGPIAVMRGYKTSRWTERPLAPTFRSYIISREYELKWRLELDVAGEKIKIDSNGSRPITVLDPNFEDLEAFAKTADFLKGKQREGAENEEDSEDESQGSESAITGTSTSTGTMDLKGRLKRLVRMSKSAEAAEEAAATAAAETSASSSGPLEYQPGEVLPRYEAPPTDFGYRNEIDEQPPRYEEE